MVMAVIGLASNVNPYVNIDKAGLFLEDQFRVVKKSTFVKTQPIEQKEAHFYLNGAVMIETDLNQEQLQLYLKKFEGVLGRDRVDKQRVVIDLDLLVFDGEVVHQDVAQRDFVKRAVDELM